MKMYITHNETTARKNRRGVSGNLRSPVRNLSKITDDSYNNVVDNLNTLSENVGKFWHAILKCTNNSDIDIHVYYNYTEQPMSAMECKLLTKKPSNI